MCGLTSDVFSWQLYEEAQRTRPVKLIKSLNNIILRRASLRREIEYRSMTLEAIRRLTSYFSVLRHQRNQENIS